MNRIRNISIVIIITSSVMIILSATDLSALINVFLIGIGVLSIVAVLWCLVEMLNRRNYKIGKIFTSQIMMKVLFVLLIITAFTLYISSKMDLWEARQIEKALLQQNPALIENHRLD
ncbi:MAG: hypothetical protein OXI67_01520 [Candidatus Poribacteria bacterium]|nr:hypothetical protein [Candidatus Poribacteria bacterium]